MDPHTITREDKTAINPIQPGVAQVMNMRFRHYTEQGAVTPEKIEAVRTKKTLVMSVGEIYPDDFKNMYTAGRRLQNNDLICLKFDEAGDPRISIATPEEVKTYLVTTDASVLKKIAEEQDEIRRLVWGDLGIVLPKQVSTPSVVAMSNVGNSRAVDDNTRINQMFAKLGIARIEDEKITKMYESLGLMAPGDKLPARPTPASQPAVLSTINEPGGGSSPSM